MSHVCNGHVMVISPTEDMWLCAKCPLEISGEEVARFQDDDESRRETAQRMADVFDDYRIDR